MKKAILAALIVTSLLYGCSQKEPEPQKKH